MASEPALTKYRNLSVSEQAPLLQERTSSSSVTPWSISLLMILFGLASLLPWNIVITAHGYFQHKFEDTNSTIIIHHFPSYFQLVGLGSNFGAALLSVFVVTPDNQRSLLVTSNLLVFLMFVLMTITTRLGTDTWACAFFVQSLVLFGASLAMMGLYMSAMLALASMISSSAVQGFYLGQGSAGLFAALLSIFTLLVKDANPVHAAFFYFLTACIVLLIALFGLHTLKTILKKTKLRESLIERTDSADGDVSTYYVLARTWRFHVTTTVSSTVTGSCFPAALSTVLSMHPDYTHVWYTTFFLPVTIFLLFAVGDVLGRVTSSFLPYPSPLHLLPVSLLRLFLVPLVFACNLHPRTIPVLFTHDVWPGLLTLLLSWSNGHVMSLAASYCPLQVRGNRARSKAGTFMTLSYATGLLLGSVVVVFLLELINL